MGKWLCITLYKTVVLIFLGSLTLLLALRKQVAMLLPHVVKNRSMPIEAEDNLWPMTLRNGIF